MKKSKPKRTKITEDAADEEDEDFSTVASVEVEVERNFWLVDFMEKWSGLEARSGWRKRIRKESVIVAERSFMV